MMPRYLPSPLDGQVPNRYPLVPAFYCTSERPRESPLAEAPEGVRSGLHPRRNLSISKVNQIHVHTLTSHCAGWLSVPMSQPLVVSWLA